MAPSATYHVGSAAVYPPVALKSATAVQPVRSLPLKSSAASVIAPASAATVKSNVFMVDIVSYLM